MFLSCFIIIVFVAVIFIYLFILYRYDRIPTYRVSSIMIALTIRPKHQSVFGVGRVRTPDLLFNKRLYQINQLKPTV